MNELEKIIAEAEHARALRRPVALATVVDVDGSAYRLPGARMLIVDGRWVAGSISGGCLEDDVVLRAGEAIRTNEVASATYDTTSEDDIVFGVGLGCRGIITVLIEPVRQSGQGLDFVGFAHACLKSRETGVAATVVRIQGQVKALLGGRMLTLTGSSTTDITDSELKAKIQAAIEQLPFGGSLLTTISLERGLVDVFLEHIVPPVPLVVFGAGHDAMPVVRLAKELGWHITVVDHRPAYATTSRFPLADNVVLAVLEDALRNLKLDNDTLVLVMTHNYLRDLKLLEFLLPSPVRYLGLLGPRKRADQLLAELTERGFQPTPSQLNRVYTPVGLDIGAESPAEVALSMLAEMHAVITSHPGGLLRERKSGIHSK